jgi:hypothetical protein
MSIHYCLTEHLLFSRGLIKAFVEIKNLRQYLHKGVMASLNLQNQIIMDLNDLLQDVGYNVPFPSD